MYGCQMGTFLSQMCAWVYLCTSALSLFYMCISSEHVYVCCAYTVCHVYIHICLSLCMSHLDGVQEGRGNGGISRVSELRKIITDKGTILR